MTLRFLLFVLALAALAGCRAGQPAALPAAAPPVASPAGAPTAFTITAFGAVGDGHTDDAPAIQRALDACAAAGGGRVVVPAGRTFLAGPFELRSHVEFCVEAGARVLANPDPAVYRKSAFRANVREGTTWISGDNLEQVTLCGGGSIDGNGLAFMGPPAEDSYELKPFQGADPRPHVLTLVGGRQLRLRDLTIGNAAYWTIHLVGCNDVALSNLTVRNSLRVRNSDGIDVDHSKNVRITGCYIESGDDGICLKNRREYAEFGACENITVTGCTLTSRSCAIKLGSENMDTIRHVVVSGCVIRASNRGVGIQNRDEGSVYDVLFADLLIESHLFSDVWWGKAEPIYVTAYRRASSGGVDANPRFAQGQTQGRVGPVHDISFSNIKCRSENGIYVSAETPDKVYHISFDQVEVLLAKTTSYPGGFYDRRPSAQAGLVAGTTSAFYFANASQLTVRNCTVGWGPHRPAYYAHALESYAVAGLTIQGLIGEAAFPQRLAATKQKPTLPTSSGAPVPK